MITSHGHTRAPSSRWGQWRALAAVLLLLASVGGIGVALYDPTDGDDFQWRMLGMTLRPDDGFGMGKVHFSMTPAMVRRLHPAHTAGTDAYGRTVMSFDYNDGRYTVWFLDQQNRQQAYRIRLRQTFSDSDEAMLLSSLGKQFGRPATSACETRATAPTQACTYSWHVASVDVAARIKTPPPVGPAATATLDLTAENIELASLENFPLMPSSNP